MTLSHNNDPRVPSFSQKDIEQDIVKYKQAISWLMENESGVAIGNSRPEHAAALYELFFAKAKKEIRILCKNVSCKVFDDPKVKAALFGALSSGTSVKFIVQESPESSCVNETKKYPAFELRIADAETKKLLFNYCVKDRESFRFESDKEKTEAFAKMYMPNEADKLWSHFDMLWNRAAHT